METQVLGLEITELRLGLPGVSVPESVAGAGGKKEVMTTKEEKKLKKKKRAFAEMMMSGTGDAEDENSSSNENSTTKSTRVVGWPPVCSYRQKNSTTTTTHALAAEKKKINNGAAGGERATKFYVKVSMDGAPYLRKVDLGAHKGYSDLSAGLKQLFGCFGIGGSLAGEDQSDNSEYVTVYEDREGDWMLVGDVPWKMFTDSCKRLRIMKSSEAKGFQLQLKSSPAGVEQRSSNRQHC